VPISPSGASAMSADKAPAPRHTAPGQWRCTARVRSGSRPAARRDRAARHFPSSRDFRRSNRHPQPLRIVPQPKHPSWMERSTCFRPEIKAMPSVELRHPAGRRAWSDCPNDLPPGPRADHGAPPRGGLSGTSGALTHQRSGPTFRQNAPVSGLFPSPFRQSL
jgi:hypothetical protein